MARASSRASARRDEPSGAESESASAASDEQPLDQLRVSIGWTNRYNPFRSVLPSWCAERTKAAERPCQGAGPRRLVLRDQARVTKSRDLDDDGFDVLAVVLLDSVCGIVRVALIPVDVVRRRFT